MAWWMDNRIRMIQNNLRDIDAAMDVDALIADLEKFDCNCVMVGAAGISSFFDSKLPYQTLQKRLEDIKGRGVVLKEGQNLQDLFEERAPLYEKYADIQVEESGLDVEQTVEEILRELNFAFHV